MKLRFFALLILSITFSWGVNVCTRDFGEEFRGLAQLYGQVSEDRAKLKDIRDRNTQIFKTLSASEKPDYAGLMRQITAEKTTYLQNIIDEEARRMPLSPTAYAIYAMGSMPRQECGLVTDVEIGFIVQDKTPITLKYFAKLSQRISDRLFLLGEHPAVGGKGFRLDEANNSPFHYTFDNRYTDHKDVKKRLVRAIQRREFDKIPIEGSRVLLTTPRELAQYSASEHKTKGRVRLSNSERHKVYKHLYRWERKRSVNASLSKEEIMDDVKFWVSQATRKLTAKERGHVEGMNNLLRNCSFIYGDPTVYNLYMSHYKRILRKTALNPNGMVVSRRHEIAVDKLSEELDKYIIDPDNFVNNGQLGSKIDLKRQFYRLIEQIITNLGFFYGASEQNTLDIVDFLVTHQHMSVAFGVEMKELMNFAMGLRLKKQDVLKKQGFAIFIDEQEFEKERYDLEKNVRGLNKMIEFQEKRKDDPLKMERRHFKRMEAERKLQDHLKALPGSIIDENDALLMNTRYIPSLQKLYQASMAWLHGDLEAFMR